MLKLSYVEAIRVYNNGIKTKGDKMKSESIREMLKLCKDTRNPKWELNGILVEKNKLVATNTRHLLILEFDNNFVSKKDGYISLIDINKSIGLSRPKNINKMLDANLFLLDNLGFKVCSPDGKFPDYNRVIPSGKNCKKANFIFDCYEFDGDYLFYRCIMLNKSFFDSKFLFKFCQSLQKTKESFEIELTQHDENSQIMIYGMPKEQSVLKSFKYIVMPTHLNEKNKGDA